MNVGMLACYDQAKEVCATLLNDPMVDGPALPTKCAAAAAAVRYVTLRNDAFHQQGSPMHVLTLSFFHFRVLLRHSFRFPLTWSSRV
jgi:predicted amidohydrolase